MTTTLAGQTPVTVSLGHLSFAYNGQTQSLSPTTSPAGRALAVTYDGSSTPPTAAGSYTVVATVIEPGYAGSASGTMVINPSRTFRTWAGLAGTAGITDGPRGTARFANPSGIAVDAQGLVYVTDFASHTVRRIGGSGAVTTLAGLAGSPNFSWGGTGSSATFNHPRAVAVDAAGNLYVADLDNQAVRKITPAGAASVVVGSPGYNSYALYFSNAHGWWYQYYKFAPSGIAVDAAGVVYAADYANNAIQAISTGGAFSHFSGQGPLGWGYADGDAAHSFYYQPVGITLDGSGRMLVADMGNHAIRRIAADGSVSTLAGAGGTSGFADGAGAQALFNSPLALAVDPADGATFILDGGAMLRRLTTTGNVTVVAGLAGTTGSADGQGSTARFNGPQGLAIDAIGTLYIADTGNHTLRVSATHAPVITSATIANAQRGATFAGYALTALGAPSSIAATGLPAGLTFDADTGLISGTPTAAGTSEVALSATNEIGTGTATLTLTVGKSEQTITFGPLSDRTLGDAAFTLSATASSGLTPTFAVVSGPAYVSGGTLTLLGAGTVVVRASQAGDADYHAAPDVDQSFTVAKGAANLQLSGLTATYDGTAKSVVVAQLAKVTTFAGLAGNYGSVDAVGTAARLSNPKSVATDSDGNVYFSDSANTIRRITPAGAVTTIAGTAGSGGSTDGIGAAARFTHPNGLTVTADGTIYVADEIGATIRKIAPDRAVTTLAGSFMSNGFADGTGSAARFHYPQGVALDSSGVLLVSDYYNYVIRKVTAARAVSTWVGSPQNSGTADGTGSAARFRYLGGIALDAADNLYVADAGNSTIRKVTPAGVVSTVAGSAGSHGFADGLGAAARFYNPVGVTVDADGNLYIADGNNSRIRKVTPTGRVSTLAGNSSQSSADGIGTAASFYLASGVALDRHGNLYVADYGNSTIRKLTGVTGSVSVTYDGGTTTPTAAGSYAVVATLTDAHYQASVNGTLVIARAAATVSLSDLTFNYDGTAKSPSATTNPAGLAVAFTYDGKTTTPTAAGSYAVVATIADPNYQGSASGTLVINPVAQTIMFPSLAARTLGAGPFTLGATASSGLNVTYTCSDPSVATIDGVTVTLVGAGTTVITAHQPGDGNYLAAADVSQTLTVASTGTGSSQLATDDFNGTAGAAPDAAKFITGGDVVQDGHGLLHLSTNTTQVSWLRTIAAAAPGTGQTLHLTFRASAYAEDWNPGIYGDGQPRGLRVGTDSRNAIEFFSAAKTSIGLRVVRDGVAITTTHAFPANVYALHTYEITVTSTAVTFLIDGVTYGTVTSNIPTGALNFYADTDDGGGVGNVPISIDSVTLALAGGGLVAGVAPAITAQPVARELGAGSDASFSVAAAGTAPLTYQWQREGVDLADGGIYSGATTATLTLTGARYSAAGDYTVVVRNLVGTTTSTAARLTVNRQWQLISFVGPLDQAFGATPLTLAASATSGLPVTFTLVSGPAVLSGGSLQLTGSGAISLRADQAGDDTYAPAESITWNFQVSANFDSWTREKFNADERLDPAVSGPTGHATADGLPNLVKYALGLEPKQVATVANLPTVTIENGDWVYRYTTSDSVTDATCTVEFSTDLVHWTAQPSTRDAAASTNGQSTWRARSAIGSAGTIFFRLRVTR